jgi:Lon protease-like protein
VRLRRVLAVRSELGDAAAPATLELTDDPVLASYQATAVAPIGPADQQRLLEQPDARSRVDRLDQMLAEEETFLSRRLALESGDAEDDAP